MTRWGTGAPATTSTRRFWAPIFALAAALAMAVPVAADGRGRCDTSIQERLDRAAPGATINLPDGCVYRESIIIDKPVTLIGGPGVEIRGSEVWSNWTKSGPYWKKGPVADFEPIDRIGDAYHPFPCKDGTVRCQWPEQVFIDGQPLEQVSSNPVPGQFAVDANRNVILAQNPRWHVVEVTARPTWVDGRADNVTIDGFVMEHAANGIRNAALNNNGHANWTVRNSNLSYAHTAIVTLKDGVGMKIEDSAIHHGGLIGLNGSGGELEVLRNRIHNNNTEDFYPGWVAGGVKVANMSRLVVDGNSIHHNDRNGVWADVGCQNVTISNNRVHHNLKRGLHLEIGDRARIFGNVVWENGWGDIGGVGLSATASRDVEIYDNIVAWNLRGIAIVNTDRDHGRGGSDPIFDQVYNVAVHHNTILVDERPGVEDLSLIWRKGYPEGNIYNPEANNRGYDNRYWYDAPENPTIPPDLGGNRFLWDPLSIPFGNLSAFNATPGEENGRYLTDAEKNRLARDKRFPANPAPH